MKIYCSFRQTLSGGISVYKEIELAAIPYPGTFFEYADGWGLASISPASEKGLHLQITSTEISIDGYGPQFDAEEITALEKLGWEYK